MSTDQSRRIFFVVGSPRSGTTLLQSMLMQSPGVTIPPETKYMGITYRREGRNGAIGTDAGWAAAVKAVLGQNDRSEFPVETEALRDRLEAPGERTHRRLLGEWLDLCGEVAGAEIVGEKSPAHTEYVGVLSEWFPEARFVHIVRDPRDVVLSHREVWKRPPLQAALRWRFDQKFLRRYAAENPDAPLRTVRYEDLVAAPEETIRGIASFLGLEFIPEMADPSNRADRGFAAHETHKLQTLERVTTGRIGRYKGKLSRSDLAVVQAVCGSEMRALGYELEPVARIEGLVRGLGMIPSLVAERLQRQRTLSARLDGDTEEHDAV